MELIKQAKHDFVAQTMLTDFANAINKRDYILSRWSETVSVLERIYIPGVQGIDASKLTKKQKSFLRRFKIYNEVWHHGFALEHFRMSMIALN